MAKSRKSAKNSEWITISLEGKNLGNKYEMNRNGDVRNAKTLKVLSPGRPDSSPFVILLSEDKVRVPLTVSKLLRSVFGETAVPTPAPAAKPEPKAADRPLTKEEQRDAIKRALAGGAKVKAVMASLGVTEWAVRQARKGA